jgi:hypothetical protein
VNALELELRIAECRPHWPQTVESAWAVFWDAEAQDYAIEGPYDTPEEAHRVTIPVGGKVYYNCVSPEMVVALMVTSEALSAFRRPE